MGYEADIICLDITWILLKYLLKRYFFVDYSWYFGHSTHGSSTLLTSGGTRDALCCDEILNLGVTKKLTVSLKINRALKITSCFVGFPSANRLNIFNSKQPKKLLQSEQS